MNKKIIFDLFIKKLSEGDDNRYKVIRDTFLYASELLEEAEYDSEATKNEYYQLALTTLFHEWDYGMFILRGRKIFRNRHSLHEDGLIHFDKNLMNTLENEMSQIKMWIKKETQALKDSESKYSLTADMMEYIETIVYFWLGECDTDIEELDYNIHDLCAENMQYLRTLEYIDKKYELCKSDGDMDNSFDEELYEEFDKE